ncbi:MAG TPA: GMC family oxidoreductase [Vicinamibacterales bacterium]|nr:GMC family oxidoreductase [Vicinamibacterales bacterium]
MPASDRSRSPRFDEYDVIVIGSGAGGGTLARALADTSARLLLVERGDFIPSEPENWDPAAVWKHLRYRTTERWLDDTGELFQPYTHYNVGGNTKFWGSVLYRLRRDDFGEVVHRDGVSPAWPIDYDTLEPFYERAEQMYQVHGAVGDDLTEGARNPYPHAPIPHAANMARVVDQLKALGLHPSPLPLGLVQPGEPGGCVLCNTCNSFPCRLGMKSDAEVCAVAPAVARSTVELVTNALATRLVTNAAGDRVDAVELQVAGTTRLVRGTIIVVSCGAVNSAALLLRSSSGAHPDGLANSSGLVGRRYMAHLATMMQGFHPLHVNTDMFQKTVAINDFYFAGPGRAFPLGQIQSQGRTHGVMAQIVVPWVPLWAYNAWVARGVDWLCMSEDLPDPGNRVTVEPDGRIRLAYRPNNERAHNELVRRFTAILKQLGFWKVMAYSHRSRNTTHQCGTLVFGTDPRHSVLDTFCRTHDVANLYVVDASFFPSSAAVNPGLTIAAQALRVADHIRQEHL